MQALPDKEQSCDVANAPVSSERLHQCKEGGQRGCCQIYSSVSQLDGGIAQLVERLVRNEKARGSNPLTSSFSRVCEKTVTDEADQVMHLPVED